MIKERGEVPRWSLLAFSVESHDAVPEEGHGAIVLAIIESIESVLIEIAKIQLTENCYSSLRRFVRHRHRLET